MKGAVAGALGVVLALAATAPARAAEPKVSATTGVGLHNVYDQATFPYFTNALASGAGLIEVDVWTDTLAGRKRWRVSHDNPFGNANNCTGQGATGNRNQDLGSCLDDLRRWHDSRPNHPLLVVKLEMKDGFDNTWGMGPDELDALIAAKLGPLVFRPADLLGGHATLDAAAIADNWPTRDQLAGRVLFEIIPGTFEQRNPFDTYWTDREYATHLRGLAAAGTVASAQVFPAVLGAAGGDPRTRYADASIRPWFVIFDGAAGTYAQGGIDTAWYHRQHYTLVMTDAHAVAPAIDHANPTPQQAADRVRLLAARHASYVTSDWARLPEVLSMSVPRG